MIFAEHGFEFGAQGLVFFAHLASLHAVLELLDHVPHDFFICRGVVTNLVRLCLSFILDLVLDLVIIQVSS